MALEAGAIPDDLEQVRRRFEEFRAARSGRSRLPETLWTAAAEMAKRYGVNRTAQVLRLEYGGLRKREPSDKRTGVFTSGIVATREGRKIALYFTGRQHAGENLADVLKQRAAELPAPVQMADALSRNVPKLTAGVEIMIANRLAHGRRQFVDSAATCSRRSEECTASKPKHGNAASRRRSDCSSINSTAVP